MNRIVAVLITAALAANGLVRADSIRFHRELQLRAQAYADTMIALGRDRWNTPSPMFASALTRDPIPDLLPDRRHTWPPVSEGIRLCDRDVEGGNVFYDQQLFQLLYALSAQTGRRSYAQAADEALAWLFQHTQSRATGLLAWGEHLGWDFRREAPYVHRDVGDDAAYLNDVHEYVEPWELWDACYRLAPVESRQFAQGLWDHQMFNHSPTDLRFSRHARYSAHEPGTGCEFPRHGGYYLHTWAEAYAHCEDAGFRATMLTAIDSVVQSYLQRRQPNGALPAGTDPEHANAYWAESNLELANLLDRARPGLPGATAAKMAELANSLDAVFLGLPHELQEGGHGFALIAEADTLRPTDPRRDRKAWSSLWHTSYGGHVTAEIALLCFARTENLVPGKVRDAYANLCLEAARLYLRARPDVAPRPGDAIGRWSMDEIDQHTARSSLGRHDGARLQGGATWTPHGGHSGGAVMLQGDDGRLIISGLATDTLRAFTFAAWVNPEATRIQDPAGRVFSHEADDVDDFCLALATENGGVRAVICNTVGAKFESVSATTLPVHAWSHLAVTYDDAGDRRLHLYLDGDEVEYARQDTVTGTLRRAERPLTVGNRARADAGFRGSIDEVQVFPRRLGAGEVAAVGGFALWPGTVTHVINLMTAAFELSGDPNYLDGADTFAQLALDTFLPDREADPTSVSRTALPCAWQGAFHYESIAGADDLMWTLYCLGLESPTWRQPDRPGHVQGRTPPRSGSEPAPSSNASHRITSARRRARPPVARSCR